MRHPKEVIDYFCTDCRLHLGRKNVVWGNLNYLASLVFIGEGPGRLEDIVGLAFSGDSGQLLTKILYALKIALNDCLFLNLIKCKPPNNRNPKKDEIEACDKWLRKQFLCCPNIKVIVALGVVPWKGLTGIEMSVTKYHGKVIKEGKYRILYTYHPSYLLRNQDPEKKKEFMRDIIKAAKLAGIKR